MLGIDEGAKSGVLVSVSGVEVICSTSMDRVMENISIMECQKFWPPSRLVKMV